MLGFRQTTDQQREQSIREQITREQQLTPQNIAKIARLRDEYLSLPPSIRAMTFTPTHDEVVAFERSTIYDSRDESAAENFRRIREAWYFKFPQYAAAVKATAEQDMTMRPPITHPPERIAKAIASEVTNRLPQVSEHQRAEVVRLLRAILGHALGFPTTN
jgi:hypothetical protein